MQPHRWLKNLRRIIRKKPDKRTPFFEESELDYANDYLKSAKVDLIVDKDILEETTYDGPEDPVVARLKKRIESMVDKIELQLSDVQVKIGDKLHYLDKDMDGILSRVEMADVLSQVLKDLSFEEALEIADEMVRLKTRLSLYPLTTK